MWKVTTEKFKKPKDGGAYLSERTQIIPQRHIHPKSVLIDLSTIDERTASHIREVIKRHKRKVITRKGKEPIDYGITEKQFYNIIDKASQSIEESKEKHS